MPFIGLSYLGRQWTSLPFIPFDVFDWLTRALPGRVISAGIDTMVRAITLLGLGPIGNAAKRIEQLLGIAIVVAGAALLGGLVALIMRRKNWQGDRVGAVVGAGAFLVVAAMDIELRTPISAHPGGGLLWLASITVGWGWGTASGAWIGSRELGEAPGEMTEASRAARRALLLKLAETSLGAALAGWGVALLAEGTRRAPGSCDSGRTA